jgi:hypothetical protein
MADPVMPASPARAAPVRANDLAFLRVLEASIETLKAENEILKRRLADAEARAAQETAKADGAIAELRALMQLRTWAAALGDGGDLGTARSAGGRARLAVVESSGG